MEPDQARRGRPNRETVPVWQEALGAGKMKVNTCTATDKCPDTCDCVALGCDHIGTKMHYLHPRLNYCGYGNCFRPYFAMRGFMPVCEVHLAKPSKFGPGPYTGSVFVKVRQ